MDNIVPLSKSDIISIIKQCKSSKVKRLKIEGLELEFPEHIESSPRKMSFKKIQSIDELDQMANSFEIEQDMLDEAMLLDPEMGEQMLIDRQVAINGKTS